MPEWQKKLAQLCDALGPAGDAIFQEIADAVLEEIDIAVYLARSGCSCNDND